MPKIDLPSLSGELSAASVTAWLNACTDSFEVHDAMSDKKVAQSTRIVMAGLKMEASAASAWWNENRDALKKLASFTDFDTKVRERFIPTNWKMDALATFYGISQGTSTLLAFVEALQSARNALASGGSGFTISDSVYKNHLLFHCHPILSLRVRSAIVVADYATMRVDALVAKLASTWDILIAERVVRSGQTVSQSASQSASAAKPTTTIDKETLRRLGGCFRCEKTPSSPGWSSHNSSNCPGDPSRGIPPAPKRTKPVAHLDDEDSDEEVLAVVPSCVLSTDDEDSSEEEKDTK